MDYLTLLDENVTYGIITTDYGRRFCNIDGQTLIEEFNGTTHKLIIYYEACRNITLTRLIVKRHLEEYVDMLTSVLLSMTEYGIRRLDVRLDWKNFVKESES